MGSSPPPSNLFIPDYQGLMKTGRNRVPKKYHPVLDNLRAIALGILEIREKEAYWREKWRQYKGRRKWRTIKEKLPLLERYRQYFNEFRGAGIEIIGSVSAADPTNREIRVRYKDGRPDVPLGDVLNWTQLFDKLSAMHPKKPL